MDNNDLYFEKFWEVLEKADDDVDLYDSIKKSGLDEGKVVEKVKQVLTEFAKKWSFIGTRSFTLLGYNKEISKMAHSDLFGYVVLLHKCRNTPPKIASSGGLPYFFEQLEKVHIMGKKHPTYYWLKEVRNHDIHD